MSDADSGMSVRFEDWWPHRSTRLILRSVTVRTFGLALAFTLLMCGCGGGSGNQRIPDANRADCAGSIRFHGTVYVYDTRLNQAAPKGRRIGPGAVMDCDHRTVVDRVVVSTVKSAD